MADRGPKVSAGLCNLELFGGEVGKMGFSGLVDGLFCLEC